MKIYTKTGDDGSTGLLGGGRANKSDPRFECIGAVDELNATMGWCVVVADADLNARIRAVQNDLFVIGSHLAAPDATSAENLPALDETMIGRLEMQIDATEAQLEPLRNFILPGGCEAAARVHVARTACRRAEREIVSFSHDRPVNATIITYLNRLSDWLFVHARLCNKLAGFPDVPWNPGSTR